MSTDFFKSDITLSTSPFTEGEIVETKGVLITNVTLARHVGKDILAGLSDFFGGRSKSWEKTLTQAQMEAVKELEEKAKEVGANGIISISIADETITKGIKNVKATGTAVVIKK